jgi:hypothetical protein
MKPEERLQRITEAVAFSLNPVPWLQGDGKTELHLKDMKTSHIQNALRMMREKRMKRKGANGLKNNQWERIFQNELIRREFIAMPEFERNRMIPLHALS